MPESDLEVGDSELHGRDFEKARGPQTSFRPWLPDGPNVPVCTPKHRAGRIAIPVDDFIPPRHFVRVPAYVNGWCMMVWILRGDMQLGASPLSAALGPPDQERLITPANQALLDRVARDIGEANQILKSCDIAFRICEINLLDLRRMFAQRGNTRRYPQDLPVGNKWRFGGAEDFMSLLREIVNDGFAWAEGQGGRRIAGEEVHAALRAKFEKRCLHLFYASDVEDIRKPDNEMRAVDGVGGQEPLRATSPRGRPLSSPYAMVESDDSGTGNTIAHEIGHALGLPHADDPDGGETDPRVRGDGENLMRRVPGSGTRLQKSQCERMNQAISDLWLAPACP